MSIRTADPGDAAGIRELSHAVGQVDADSGADGAYVDLLLRTATVCVAADPSSRAIAGWGAVRDGPLGSMLTDLFVHPEQHGRGIGTALLHALWPDHAAPARFTFSSQDPRALPLYARAGLLPSWPLLYLTGRRSRLPASTVDVEQVRAADASAADSQLVGGDRADDYDFWTRSRDSAAVIVRDGERLVGAGVLRGGELVHLTCPPDAAGAQVLAAVLRTSTSEDVTACVPGQHPGVTSLLQAGFRVTDYDLTMSTPGLSLPVTWAYSPGLG